ncbi:MAG: hypothetical protein OEV42_14195 [Deltaproteobacteria bacterium]|nr:hypothetical protein [Deltaproteobacteria bacterium]
MKKDNFANQATKKILGIEYQKLIALEKCFEAKPNEFIWLECFGDVADSDTSAEIKHHLENENLTDVSVDFWKTLRNFVREKHLLNQFNHLILHTTAKVKSTSIFKNWNNSDKNTKLEKLKNITPTKTIKEMFVEIFEIDQKELMPILDKFKIEYEQPNINEKVLQLKNHPAMITIPDQYKDRCIEGLIGYITKKAIDNPNRWHIEKNVFNRDFQHLTRPYIKDDLPFPVVEKNEVDVSERKAFTFVKEIRVINYSRKIDRAISNYLRANLSRIKLLENTPAIDTNLDSFDDNLKDELEDKKITYSEKVNSSAIGTDDAHKVSRELYDNCLNIPNLTIDDVQPIKQYYQRGRVHNIVEEEGFKWRFEEEDL